MIPEHHVSSLSLTPNQMADIIVSDKIDLFIYSSRTSVFEDVDLTKFKKFEFNSVEELAQSQDILQWSEIPARVTACAIVLDGIFYKLTTVSWLRHFLYYQPGSNVRRYQAIPKIRLTRAQERRDLRESLFYIQESLNSLLA